VFTNELKKGDRILQFNGWYGTIKDNAKGNIRIAEVEGFETETGSIYAHDIAFKINPDGLRTRIEHTPAQIKLRNEVTQMFGG